MNREQLLEFAKQVESFVDDDQWRVVTTLINCAHQDWAITEADKKSFLRTLAAAQKTGLSTVPLAIVLELGGRIVPDFWGRGILITGPSDQFPSDVSACWSIKLNGVRLGAAKTLTLALAATISRLIATERDRSMSAEFRRQRQEASADVAALKARLEQRAAERK
jgi:hypothetical protein